MQTINSMAELAEHVSHQGKYHLLINDKFFVRNSHEISKGQVLEYLHKSTPCRFNVYYREEQKHKEEEILLVAELRADSAGQLEHELERVKKIIDHLEKELHQLEHKEHHEKWIRLRDDQVVQLSGHHINIFHVRENRAVNYYLADQKVPTNSLVLTPKEILTAKFGDKADQYYLKQLLESGDISYQDKPDEPIPMCPDLRFIYIYTGPMPVSSF